VLARAIAEERDAERLAHARAELDDEERRRHARLLQEQDDLHRAVKRSRERVGVKNVGQFMSDKWLSNRCKTWSPISSWRSYVVVAIPLREGVKLS
jgi:hypothetical protein